MIARKMSSLVVAAALLVSVAGSAFAATVPGSVYGPKGETRPTTEVQQILTTSGVQDVTPDHWAAGSISVLLEAGLMAPDANGNVNPDSTMDFNTGTAVFAKVLGLASPTDTPEVAAQKAVDAGLIAAKEGPMTRLDVAVLIAKALGIEAKPGVLSDSVGFADASAIPAEYWGIIAALKEAGIFKGFPDGTFQPTGELTAAQVAALVDRVLGATAAQ